ncbi:MAG: hypothetical protein EOP89_07835 [Lysobacteraceae bacterium]|nr:MAG: hypothetical protein EOP89_07835 [Xanthomonadaceae bacterium]
MDVYLSLYVLPDDDGNNVILPFLIAAVSEDDAVDRSDSFIEAIETVANPESEALEADIARNEIETMRPMVFMMDDESEIAAVRESLRQHNPNFEDEVKSMAGSTFTVKVDEESGFTAETTTLLRNRMSGHYVYSALSVEFD